MSKRTRLLLQILSICPILVLAQEQRTIEGLVVASDEVEGIHVLNETLDQYAVTSEDGKFQIKARVQDTIYFSSIKYAPKTVIVTSQHLTSGKLIVEMEEFVNVLDEVIIGRILTGDLSLDLDISETKRDINFYDVGIPGNTNLPITQKERRLHEADAGKFIYYGIGFAINVHKILNRISGRTRKLRELVALEDRDECMDKTRHEFSSILFEEGKFKDEEIVAFFFFASEDIQFSGHCLTQNKMNMFTYLKEKREVFLSKLNSHEWEEN